MYIREEKNNLHMKLEKVKDKIYESLFFLFALLCAVVLLFIFIFIVINAWSVIKASGFGFITKGGFSEQISNAFSSENQDFIFGLLGLIVGTLMSTLGGLIIAIPVGIGTAVVITQYTPAWLRDFLIGIIRLLASIPSIIFGLIGLIILVPLVKDLFITSDMQIKYLSDPILRMQLDGRSILVGILLLGIMMLPIITTLSVDAIIAVPKAYKEAAFALGYSHWRVISKVLLPASTSGIYAGVILAAGRGTGEAIALSMVTGGISNIPQLAHGGVMFLTPVLTLASAIVNKSEAMAVPSIKSALFACGTVLLCISLIFSISTKLVQKKINKLQ